MTENAEPVAQPTLATRPTPGSRIRSFIVKRWGPGDKGIENKSSNELAELRTDLAATRTLMAADRTLMAWVRTALSMFSFGFTIYKILQAFQGAGQLPQGYTPRSAGLLLIGLGTFAMVMGTIEYWGTLREVHHVQSFRIARPALIMALVMSVLGLFLFFGIVVRLL